MNCPRCNNVIQNDALFCSQCGLQTNIPQTQPNQFVQQPSAGQPKRVRLIGNGIYSIYMFYKAFIYIALGLLLLLSLLFSLDSVETVISLLIVMGVSFIIGAIPLIIGILLWKRKKIGWVIALLNNILHIILGVPVTIFGAYYTYIGIISTGDYEKFNAIFGFPIFLTGLGWLILGISFLIYYIIQRKHFA